MSVSALPGPLAFDFSLSLLSLANRELASTVPSLYSIIDSFKSVLFVDLSIVTTLKEMLISRIPKTDAAK